MIVVMTAARIKNELNTIVRLAAQRPSDSYVTDPVRHYVAAWTSQDHSVTAEALRRNVLTCQLRCWRGHIRRCGGAYGRELVPG